MPDEARFVVFMAAAFLFFVALLQFTIRKRTMKPTIKTTTAMGFVVVVFGMLFARYSHLAFPHLPWEIYYGLPALTTVLLPPLWLRMSRRHAIIDRRYAEHSILAGFVPLRDGVLAHRQRLIGVLFQLSLQPIQLLVQLRFKSLQTLLVYTSTAPVCLHLLPSHLQVLPLVHLVN
jgi:hypothetical protein